MSDEINNYTYEQDLTSKTAITTTDYVRVVGSNNISYKQLITDLARVIIEVYSDVSLAGSAQSIKHAIDTLIPIVSNEDVGKFLRVNNDGQWAAEFLQEAENEAY